jgi:hypothetical protein
MPHPANTHSASTSQHRLGDQPETLRQILDPGVNLAVWRRNSRPAIEKELSVLRAADLPDRRWPTSPALFDEDLSALLTRCGLSPGDFREFRSDVGRIAGLFFEINAGRDFRFRLATVSGNDCGRFHTDTRHLRMLCTYRGAGTEWLTDAQVDQEALRRGASNDAIIRFGEPSRIEPFWVGIMRGESDQGSGGLVHRSPAIAGSGQTRVVFCLDAEPRKTDDRHLTLTTG